MVLMAIDHVRVYSGVPAGGPSAGVFFTRWVTHFCAPAFVFLTGTGAYLHGRKLGDTRKLAGYLATRGVILVLLELTVIRASWTFGFDYSQFILAGVIWMLGWCMILLAGLVWLPTSRKSESSSFVLLPSSFLPVWAIGTLGLAVIALQDAFALPAGLLPQSWRPVWEFIYPADAEVKLGENGPSVAVLYTIVPWIGVMAAGYAFGSIVTREPRERRRLCLRIGLGATALFVAGAGFSALTSPAPGEAPPALFRFLNQRKYPASPLFLLMTLGPAIALLPAAERMHGWAARLLTTFGRVPMFYYLLHIPVIHAVALVVWLLRDGRVHPEWFATAPFVSVPPEHRWGLPLLYLVFGIVVALLYLPCRWFAGVKGRSPRGWLRFF